MGSWIHGRRDSERGRASIRSSVVRLFRAAAIGIQTFCCLIVLLLVASNLSPVFAQQVVNALRLVYQTHTTTINSNGTGARATATLTPSRSHEFVVCVDPDGCDLTVSSANVKTGTVLTITASGDGLKVLYIADQVDIGADTTIPNRGSLTLINTGSFWVRADMSGGGSSSNFGCSDLPSLVAVLSLCDEAAGHNSILDLIANNSSPRALRVWNKTFTTDGTGAFVLFQENNGIVHQYVVGDDPRYMDLYAQNTTRGYGEIFMMAAGTHNEGDGDGGVWNVAAGPTNYKYSVVSTAPLDPPGVSAITNIGTPGAQTITYRLICLTYLGYHTDAGTASTTTTANATINGSNHPRIALPATYDGCAGFDIYRTVGGATQGKIASDVAVSSFPFDDTGLVGGGELATTPQNTTGHVFTQDATADVVLASYKYADLVWTSAFSGFTFPKKGQKAWITDSNTNTWGATIAGGGANEVEAVYNGTNWTVVGK